MLLFCAFSEPLCIKVSETKQEGTEELNALLRCIQEVVIGLSNKPSIKISDEIAVQFSCGVLCHSVNLKLDKSGSVVDLLFL